MLLGGSETAIQFSPDGLLRDKASNFNDTGIAICEALTVCGTILILRKRTYFMISVSFKCRVAILLNP